MFDSHTYESVFGKDESELMVEKRKLGQNCMKHQMETAASRRKRTILRHLVDQKQDLQMLERTKKE